MSAQTETGHFADRFYTDQSGEPHTNGADFYFDSVTDAITANAGGGQANAAELIKLLSQVTVVATAADSVRLPTSYGGRLRIVTNESANSLDVYPANGDQINGASANAPYALAAGHSAIFFCFAAGDWRAISGI